MNCENNVTCEINRGGYTGWISGVICGKKAKYIITKFLSLSVDGILFKGDGICKKCKKELKEEYKKELKYRKINV